MNIYPHFESDADKASLNSLSDGNHIGALHRHRVVGEEAVEGIGVSPSDGMACADRIERCEAVHFGLARTPNGCAVEAATPRKTTMNTCSASATWGRSLATAVIILAVLFQATLNAAENMIGRQSQNEGIFAVPAPAEVVIDGDLGEWDLSGQIWTFADIGVRDRFSVKTAAMWDTDNLYLSFFWRDPMPMNSTVNPAFNPEHGWKADSVQLRVVAGGQTSWFTTWYYSVEKMPVMHVAYWKDESDVRKGEDRIIYTGKDGGTDLGEGIEMAYKPLDDGSGFIQEVKIPWRIIYKKDHTAAASGTIRMGMEFLWGDATGNTWPIHRYADNMQPGETSREFFWRAKPTWGDLTLLAEDGIEPRRYVGDEGTLSGTIPVRATLPGAASGFTLVIEDQDGTRVRNLAGSFDPTEYLVKNGGNVVEVLWDGLDDEGNPVEPGKYKVRGLTHGPLGAEYEMCYYNPGTPPWGTQDTSGAWGGDHAAPRFVARAGENMLLGWSSTEGGHGIILVGEHGRKMWGEKRGIAALAGDDGFVYFQPETWHTTFQSIKRLNVKTGAYAPFVLGGKERPFELPLSEIFGGEEPGKLLALRVAGDELVLVFDNGKVALLDKASAELRKMHETGLGTAAVGETLPDVGSGLAALSKDAKTLFVNYGGSVHAVNLADGSHQPVVLDGVGVAGALATDNDGNLLVMDIGPDQQIKAFSGDVKLVYTCAKKGGRPIRGAFDEQAVSNVSSIDVDSAGNVWAAEHWENPRRVSVWDPATGKLARDYIGNTGYAGTGAYLDETELDAAYVGSLRMRLDRQQGTYTLEEVLWVPDRSKNEGFPLWRDKHWFANPYIFTSEASGQPIKYLYLIGVNSKWHGIFMRRGETWQPVAVITTVGEMKEQIPGLDWSSRNESDGVFWNDTNADGAVQLDECDFVATERFDIRGGWGSRPGSDLSLYLEGGMHFKPIRFAADGTPVYGAAGMAKLPIATYAEAVPVLEDGLVLSMGGHPRDGGFVQAISADGSRLLWRYPNPHPSVKGSHHATMPKAGLLIGPLKILGVVDMGGDIGKIFAMRGNLGQDFYMTTDGLYVASMFQDGRLPGMSLPEKEEQLKGMPLEMFSMGSEPFNGWLGRQDDGVVRMLCGLPRQAAMVTQIKGLDSIRRFTAADLDVSEALLAQALQENAQRQAEAAKAAFASVKGWDAAKGWDALAPLTIAREGQPSKGVARLGWDEQNLYVRFEVIDPTPWLNEGRDYTRLFKTGDAVDIQLSPSGNDKAEPVEGDQRIVIANLNGKPTAVLMRPFDRKAAKTEGVNYHSPVTDKFFARVKLLERAKITVEAGGGKYVVEAVIPWNDLNMEPQQGMSIRGDVGFILSDAAGTTNTARVYWSNKDTNLVSDLPFEAWLKPAQWAIMRFE